MKKIMMWTLYLVFGSLVVSAIILNAGKHSDTCGHCHSYTDTERYAVK